MPNNSGLTFILGAAIGARYWKVIVALILLMPVLVILGQEHEIPWSYIVCSIAGLFALKLFYEICLRILRVVKMISMSFGRLFRNE